MLEGINRNTYLIKATAWSYHYHSTGQSRLSQHWPIPQMFSFDDLFRFRPFPLNPLVSSPIPGGKGLVHIERFLGLADVAFLNSVAPITFTPSGLHVIIMTPCYSHLLLYVRAVDVLPCQNDVLSWSFYDMLHPVCPKKCSMWTRHFPFSGGGSRDQTINPLALGQCSVGTKPISKPYF